MEDICRVCMVRSGAFTNIFDEPQKWTTCIADMIAECTGYLVRRGDSLPENICPPCLEDAVSAFNLKKTCEQNHKLHFTQLEKHREEVICANIQVNKNTSNLNTHKQLHTAELTQKCSECAKPFRLNCYLRTHKKTHNLKSLKQNDELKKPFECSYCLKTFKQKRGLQLHTSLHTGDRPYQCSHCTETFKLKRDLNHHIKCNHTEKNNP